MNIAKRAMKDTGWEFSLCLWQIIQNDLILEAYRVKKNDRVELIIIQTYPDEPDSFTVYKSSPITLL